MPPSYLRKSFFVLTLVIFVLVLGGLGGLLLDRYLVPYIAGVPGLSRFEFLKRTTEHVTVINTTERIVVQEGDSVEQTASQAATAVVNIIAVGTPASGTGASANVPSPGVETVTGVLLTNDGLVVTYSEEPVADLTARYFILLFNGTSHEAAYVGHDSLANLNYFRLRGAANTPAIALANSDDARVGRRLIAIGNTAAEYQNRFAVGVLENINRNFNLSGKTVASSEKWEGVFEMTLVRPEQYVGGPVVGFNGEMIGLGGAVRIDNSLTSFMVPSNVIRESLDRALSGRLATRARLGVYYLPITKAYALGQGLPRDRGALVYSPSGRTGLAVIADSPAARAGLLAGDIIIAVNGREVNLDTPLPELLSRLNSGDQAELLIIRNGEERKVPVTL